MTISPLLTFNLKVGFTFSVLSNYRVPTMQNALGVYCKVGVKKREPLGFAALLWGNLGALGVIGAL